MTDILILDYDPTWPLLFESLRQPLWNVVSDFAIAIEHVGSTSVPGLVAKPIIDVDVIVPDGEVAAAIARLAPLGYIHRGDLGIPQREAFTNPAGLPPHHLYVCPQCSPALANHLAVRDYLRAHPFAVSEYGELKKRLAREYAEDIDGYVEAKSAFLAGVLRAAGFADDALAAIENLNRRRTVV